MTRTIGALVQDVDVIALLRRLQPARALTWSEAHSVAERQAAELLDLMHISEPPIPQFVISSLPEIFLDWQTDWPRSATTFHTGTHWQIVVRSNDRRQRQRFSLAHEFKHILDSPARDRMFAHLGPDAGHERAERLCNYFAACLLMPRPWLKHDWYSGTQAPNKLARRYYVSTEAMTTRLSELGLTSMTLRVEARTMRHLKASS